MSLTKEALEALQASIEHWQRMHDHPLDCLRKNREIPGSDTCALCVAFLKSRPEDRHVTCACCPVREFTGKIGCQDTPYSIASTAWDEMFGEEFSYLSVVKWREAASKEIDFLKSLLPKPTENL